MTEQLAAQLAEYQALYDRTQPHDHEACACVPELILLVKEMDADIQHLNLRLRALSELAAPVWP